jgi:hypothetical protein
MSVFLRCAENQLLKIRSMAARWVLAISQGVMGRAIPADITPPAETKVTRADGRCCAPAARAAASEPYSHRAAATGTKGSVGLRPARRHSGAARAAVAALGLRAYARIILPALSAPLRRSGRRDEAAHAYELVSPYFTGTFYRADALGALEEAVRAACAGGADSVVVPTHQALRRASLSRCVKSLLIVRARARAVVGVLRRRGARHCRAESDLGGPALQLGAGGALRDGCGRRCARGRGYGTG